MITPIPIIISSGPSPPDHKCPKCGHTWNNPPVKMSAGAKRVLAFIVILIIALIIDWSAFRGRHTYHVILKKECMYSHTHWSIVQKGNLYAVSNGDRLLTTTILGIGAWNPEYHEPTAFYSECKAKAYLKRYVEKERKEDKKLKEKKNWK
jgi:hypothetical protein